jgi:predicted dehydrogenase
MGKRRIRNLKALGYENIIGVDPREDRRREVRDTYAVFVDSDLDHALSKFNVKAFIISLPPDIHYVYLKKAVELGIPAFVEASVVDTEMDELIHAARSKRVLIAPSCTLSFHPAIKKIAEIIKENTLGKISNIIYHSGQYLPDWHTYEKVSDYYVSKKETGGAREIVPFELTWITMLFGFPKRVTGIYKKTIRIEGAENIDDTYNLLMDFDTMIFNLSVDVVSRYATRRLMINGDKRQLFWNWEDGAFKMFDPEQNSWIEIKYEVLAAQAGYNKNITEQMYIDEVAAFIESIDTGKNFPNNLEHDHKVLKLLYAVETSDDQNKVIQF